MATASTLTESSHGGISFDELCRTQVQNYSFNVVDLKKKILREKIDLLIGQVRSTIEDLEFHSGKSIKEFCIGKTYAEARSGKTFDTTNVDTWRVSGISKRWQDYKRNKYYDGLVVLCAVNLKMLQERIEFEKVKRNCDTNVWNQEFYALALESALISHYAFEACDHRLANKSLHPGSLQETKAAGYVIYFAFKYNET